MHSLVNAMERYLKRKPLIVGPGIKTGIKIITEATEKDELQAMIQNGANLKDILSKLSDMYGENAVHEAFNEVKQNIDSAVEENPEVEAEQTEKEEIEEDDC